MKFKHKIWTGVVMVILALTVINSFQFKISESMAINVFAGDDKTMCLNQSLLIKDLLATITGDVSDGDWISFGDGRFQPGNLNTVRYQFAQANNITYVPGPNDRNLGQYRLMLISDAPINNASEKKSDEVRIRFQAAPPLFCATNINISLNEACSQVVDASMLTPNPAQPLSNYVITLTYGNGIVIPNNVLTKDHVGKEITFKLGHQCTSNFCWGKFMVEDYFPPVFICKNDTISCLKSISPDSLGYPFPTNAFIDTFYNGKYVVKNWDACSDVTLEYTDEIKKAECAFDEDRTISRKWKATDQSGNTSFCTELIVVKRLPLSQVLFPPHFDGQEKPAFECSDTFPKLANGYPSPDTTGRPTIGFCGHLQFNMTDIKFDLCGTTYKLARSWFVIDWCTSNSLTKIQIIMVKDSQGPKLACVDSLYWNTEAYQCATPRIQMPALLMATDCHSFQLTYQLRNVSNQLLPQFITTVQGQSFITALPVGRYSLTYIATDACGNTSSCVSNILVQDKTEPFVICKQVTKLAVGADGKGRIFAQSLDNNSVDNCAIATYQIRKMVDSCGFGTQLGPFVDFCCSEIGDTVMVELVVTDVYGNKNSCMVEVLIEDKLKPKITCPPDISIACTEIYDLNDLDRYGKVVNTPSAVSNIVINNVYHQGVVGKDGLATDNCGVEVTASYQTDIKCYLGTIKRKFVATDRFGLKDSCIQTIRILNPNPFDDDDIKWPTNYEANGCKTTHSNPNISGKPSFNNTTCANVTSQYEDQAFFLADGACYKVIRTWTVIDWCQFNEITLDGIWGPYIQTIKLHNTDKPIFNQPCKDTTICSFDGLCQEGFAIISNSATDACTDVSDLRWTYQLDLFNNGTIDSIGAINQFVGNLPIGLHRLHWRVEDQCGNSNTCSQIVTVVDCKKPTPYCMSSITITLDASANGNSIWARDFDLGSFDQCSSKDSLIFTFDNALPIKNQLYQNHYFKGNGLPATVQEYRAGSAQLWKPESKSSAMFFDCSDIPNGQSSVIMLKMTVTDLEGNQDYCPIELRLQDNDQLCPDVFTTADVQGKIALNNSKPLKEFDIKYVSPESTNSLHVTATDGQYLLKNLVAGTNYIISPLAEGSPDEGLTAADLVTIQRHIVGVQPFSNPYQYIAADVNTSKSITASDLLEIRKIILGITDKFPKNIGAWVFVNKNDPEFDVNGSPYNYRNHIETGPLSQNISNADFTAIKVGDVNLSYNPIQDDEVDTRNRTHALTFHVAIENMLGRDYVTIRNEVDFDMDGMQMFCTLYLADELLAPNKDEDEPVQEMMTTSYLHEKGLHILDFGPSPKHFKKGSLIRAFEVKKTFDLDHLRLHSTKESAVYSNQMTRPIVLKYMEAPKVDFGLVNNPVSGDLKIWSKNGMLSEGFTYTIVNAEGKHIMNGTIPTEQNTQEWTIALTPDMTAGMYFIRLNYKSKSQNLKFLVVK